MPAPANADIGTALYRIMRSLEHCDAAHLALVESFIASEPPSNFISNLVMIMKQLEDARSRKHSRGIADCLKRIGLLVEGNLPNVDELTRLIQK